MLQSALELVSGQSLQLDCYKRGVMTMTFGSQSWVSGDSRDLRSCEVPRVFFLGG